MLDLDAYLARIGLRGQPGLAELHRAHVTSIPFENLDPRRGIPVSLDPEDLERKLVDRAPRRLLLRAEPAAEGGARGARARTGPSRCWPGSGSARRPGSPRPRTHLVLRVQAEDGDWHADVGFGHGTLLEPIPFGPGRSVRAVGLALPGRRGRPELVLQTAQDGEWVDLYGFVPEPVPFIDVETSNWFTCTHPRSPFVTGLIVSAQRPDGTRVSLSDWEGLSLNEETPAGASVQRARPRRGRRDDRDALRPRGLRWLATA